MEPLRLRFIGNLPGLPPEQTLLVASDRDYCTACEALRNSVAAAYDSLWIRETHHFAWVRAYIEHSGLSTRRPLEFSETTARDLLEQRWRMPLPRWLSNELILSEQLLESDLPAGTHSSVEGALLAPIFGGLNLRSPWKAIGAVAEKASQPGVRRRLADGTIIGLAWNNLLARWSEAKEPSWAGALATRLADDSETLWRDLTIWRLLHGYSDFVHEFALDPAAVSFVRAIPVESVSKMSLNSEGRAIAVDQIHAFFAGLHGEKLSRDRLLELTGQVSGELREEFTALTSLAEAANFDLQSADIDLIERRFVRCGEIAETAVTSLRLLVRPLEPTTAVGSSSEPAEWKRWFHAQYLPFRVWQHASGKHDASIEETVGRFSDWYCRDFARIHSDPTLSAVQTLSQWRSLIRADSVSLIVLVDNLPWFFWESFERALRAGGLYQHETRDCFVPLPSHTSVCKPAVISGRWDVMGSEYRKMLSVRSSEEWNAKPVHYLSGVDQLTAMKSVPSPSVVFLNYLAGDETLHSDLAAAGTTHAEQLSVHYRNVGKAIGEFARRASDEDRAVGVYIITDHGSTHILESEKESIDAKLSQRLFPDEKHRSATLTADEAAEVPENLWKLGHRFADPFRADGVVHFIPRGHNTVASPQRRPVYCHGGATPEEVIVPCGVFRLYTASIREPNIRFVDLPQKAGKAAFYVKRISNIKAEIQNPNATDCHLVALTLDPAVGEIRHFDTVTIAAGTTQHTAMSIYLSLSALSESLLTFDFSFRVLEEPVITRIELPVTIASVAAGGTDLTNLS